MKLRYLWKCAICKKLRFCVCFFLLAYHFFGRMPKSTLLLALRTLYMWTIPLLCCHSINTTTTTTTTTTKQNAYTHKSNKRRARTTRTIYSARYPTYTLGVKCVVSSVCVHVSVYVDRLGIYINRIVRCVCCVRVCVLCVCVFVCVCVCVCVCVWVCMCVRVFVYVC
jgi:hypothetical protein